MAPEITNRDIFDIWLTKRKGEKVGAIVEFILQQLAVPELPDNIMFKLKLSIRSLCQRMEQKWSKARRYKNQFLKYNSTWLKTYIKLPEDVLNALPGISNVRPGRPEKDFETCGIRSQKNKVKHLISSVNSKQLCLAAEIKLRKEGKRDSASIVRELATSSPKRGTILKKAMKTVSYEPGKMSPNQALALLVDTNLSTHQYILIRNQAKAVNSSLYPPYYKVKEAKKFCYPSEITVTETFAEIKLQSLIDHTVLRLCEVQNEVLESICSSEVRNFTVIIKWGCDGADQSRYKQKFSEGNGTDENLFSVSMVPLQFRADSEDNNLIIWQNPSPSSTRYCRPIKFLFAKETTELTKNEIKHVQDQVSALSPTKFIVNDIECIIQTKMIFCMIDGKVCNAIASCASTQTCYICGAKPRDMNNSSNLAQKSINTSFLSFGLSPLHSWIRFFECLLHISYRLEIQTWQARGEENKNSVTQRKKQVQQGFRSQLGLLVDMPKQQAGNTNDGNTARKFFRNAERSAEITGLNLEIIKSFRVILECLNSGYHIDVNKFEEYAKHTRKLYLKEYAWYPMPVSVHKVLFHGADIVASCILPIGQLSEEAQEARNKDNRQYRELFTRKTSRLETNIDLLHRLLITSDPLITSIRASPKTKRSNIDPEVLKLLADPSKSLCSSISGINLNNSDCDSE